MCDCAVKKGQMSHLACKPNVFHGGNCHCQHHPQLHQQPTFLVHGSPIEDGAMMHPKSLVINPSPTGFTSIANVVEPKRDIVMVDDDDCHEGREMKSWCWYFCCGGEKKESHCLLCCSLCCPPDLEKRMVRTSPYQSKSFAVVKNPDKPKPKPKEELPQLTYGPCDGGITTYQVTTPHVQFQPDERAQVKQSHHYPFHLFDLHHSKSIPAAACASTACSQPTHQIYSAGSKVIVNSQPQMASNFIPQNGNWVSSQPAVSPFLSASAVGVASGQSCGQNGVCGGETVLRLSAHNTACNNKPTSNFRFEEDNRNVMNGKAYSVGNNFTVGNFNANGGLNQGGNSGLIHFH
ncbi:hypothetical protein HELRODRAFT_173424 [Helobdella robusta]|uniref:Uncharacterized protein n=1 Tax=Helobdella robusta TaxID=6412 RepID=T1F6T3_HELRO|nr:hypothetical protein HELRODRAFT_173424 [Helobdella robusta]ESO03722.1 hypothetical protein HELRODRAFT_173424 [Helobdella robusta]